jgi:hypothetical protein
LSNEQREVIANAVKYPFIDNRTDKNLLVHLHREVFNSEICLTCDNEKIRAYIELYRLINPKKESMNPPSKKYRFNPLNEGISISIPKLSRGAITSSSLTDAQAEYLIDHDAYKGLIVTVDEADAIRLKMESDSKIDYSEKTVKELKAILKDAGVDYSEASKKADYITLAESM